MTAKRIDFSKPDLSGARMLITGAGSGIGAAIAAAALDAGVSHVLACDIGSDILPDVKDMRLQVSRGDLCDADYLNELLRLSDAAKINVLVNAAGIFDMAPLGESDMGQYKKLFQLNVEVSFRLLQAISEQIIKRGESGSIVNFASQAGRRGEALVSHYCATKAAIISYTQSAALALASHSIRVNAVSPGVIDTPMWEHVDRLFAQYENLKPGEKKRQVADEVPLGRMGEPPDVAGLVLFLASDWARYITGQTINVDGGNVLS